MSTQFEFEVGAKLNTSSLQSDLNKQKIKPIEIKASLSSDSISKIKSQLESLSKIEINPKVGSGFSAQFQNISKEAQRLLFLAQEINKTDISIKKLDGHKNAEEIATLENQLKKLTTEFKNYEQVVNQSGKVSTGEQKLLNAEYEKMARNLERVSAAAKDKSAEQNTKSHNRELKEQERQLQKNANLMNQKMVFKGDMKAYLANNTALGKELREELLRIISAVDQVDDSPALNNLRSQFKLAKLEAKELGQTGRSFADEMKNNLSKFTSWISVATISMQAVNGVKDMVRNVYEIDTAMTNLKKVTDETDAVYGAFLDNSASKAQELGVKISDLVTQSSEWAKLGYSISEAFDLSSASSIYANVGELDNTTAVSDLVSIMKAFNIEASESITIVDSLNELGNKYATSAAGIGEGLRNSASTLALAGNDLNESAAMITGMTEITQNASESGNAIKILSMRIRGMKGDLEAIGEEYENIESVSKIQTQIYNLTNGTVNIMDDLDPTKFKSTYEIMKQISEVYFDMAETDQADLLEILAGKQRGNSIAALLQAYSSGQVDSALLDSINSENSAMKEQEAWLQSLEAKIAQFQAAFQSLSQTIVSSDILKSFVDMGTGTINVLDAIIPKLDSMPKLLTAIAGGASLFGNVGIFSSKGNQFTIFAATLDEIKEKWNNLKISIKEGNIQDSLSNKLSVLWNGDLSKLKSGNQLTEILTDSNASAILEDISNTANKGEGALKKYFSGLNDGEKYIKDYALATDEAQRTTSGLMEASENACKTQEAHNATIVASGLKAKAASVGMKLLATAGSMIAMWAISEAISFAVTKIDEFVHANEKAIEKAKELSDTYSKNSESIKSNSDWLDTNKERYLELAKGVSAFGTNMSLTDSEFKEHNNLINEIAVLFPSLVTGYTSTGDAIINLTDKSNALTVALEAQKKAAEDLIIVNTNDTYSGFYSAVFGKVDGKQSLNDQINSLSEYIELMKDADQWTNLLNSNTAKGILGSSDIIDFALNDAIEEAGLRSQGGFETYKSYLAYLKEHEGELTAYLNTLNAKVQTEAASLQPLMDAYLNQDVDFTSLEDDAQIAVKSIIKSLDTGFYEQFGDSGFTFVSWLNDTLVPALSGNQELQDAFTNLFSLQDQDLSPEAFIELRDQYIALIAEFTNQDPVELAAMLDIQPPDLSAVEASVEEPVVITLSSLLENDTEGGFKETIDNYKSSISTLQTALDDLANGDMDNTAISDLIAEFPQLANETDNLEQAIYNLMQTSTDSTMDTFDENLSTMRTQMVALQEQLAALKETGEDTSELEATIFQLEFDTSALENYRNITEAIGLAALSTADKLKYLSTTLENQKQAIATAMSESVSGSGISSETLSQLPTQYNSALEQTAMGTTLNPDKLKAVQNAEKAIIKNNFAKNRADLTKSLQTNRKELQNASADLRKCEISSKGYMNALSKLNSLKLNSAKYESELANLNQLERQYNNVQSAYEKWQDARNSPNSGEIYDSITAGLAETIDIYDIGDIGTDDFKTFAQLCTNIDLATASTEELKAAFGDVDDYYVAAFETSRPRMERFFTEGQEGCVNFLNEIQSLNSEWAHMNDDESWTIDFGRYNDNEIADALGINVEAVQAQLLKLRDCGFKIDIDQPNRELAQLYKTLEAAQEKLDSLDSENVYIDIDGNSKNAQDAVDEAQAKIDAYMRVHPEVVLNADNTEALQAIAQVYDYQTALINIEKVELEYGVNSEEFEYAQQDLQNLAAEIDGWSHEVKVAFGVEDLSTEEITQKVANDEIPIPAELQIQLGSVEDQIASLLTEIRDALVGANSTVEVEVTADTSDVETKTAKVEEGLNALKDPKLSITADTADGEKNVNRLDRLTQAMKDKTIGVTADTYGAQTAINELTKTETKTIKVNTVNYGTTSTGFYSAQSTGTAQSRGTAFASGSFTGVAKANGDWSVKNDTSALGGELGQELVVRDGRFFTIGDRGAEFFHAKKNDIIFNHRQTKELLSSNNHVVSGGGRGKAYADGTVSGLAFSSGSGKFNPGNSGSKAYSSATNTSSNVGYTDATDVAKEVEEVKENFEEIVDWVEILRDVFALATENIVNYASNILDKFYDQNKVLDQAIAKYKERISIEQRSYDRYMIQADASGLSESYKEKVRNGALDIEKITDENLRNQIKSYQEYFEKAQECLTVIDELTVEVKELAVQKLDNIVDDLDRIVSYRSQIIKTKQALIDMNISKGIKTAVKDIESMMQDQLEITYNSQQYLIQLKNEFNSLVSSGTIVKYSDQWHEWSQQIDSVAQSISDSTTAVKEFVNQIREVRWGDFFDILDSRDIKESEIETLLSLFTDGSLLDDYGSLTNAGKSKFALMAEQLVIAKQTAQDYKVARAKLDKELANGVITQAEYNEYLAEYSSAQRQAVEDTNSIRKAMISLITDGINKQTEAYDKLIKKKKEEIETSEEALEFNKKVAEKEKSIAAIQKKLNALANDDSNSAAAQRKQLQKELLEAQDELNEIYHDKEISDQLAALDEENEAYANANEERIALLESDLGAQDAAIAEYLTSIKTNYSSVYNYLNDLAGAYNLDLTSDLTSPWKSATEAAKLYQQAVNAITTSTASSVDTSKVNSTTSATQSKDEASIKSLYKELLGRDADAEGLKNWTSQLASGKSLSDIKTAMMNSEEYKQKQIKDLYKDTLGRDADSEGLKYWTNLLKNGTSLADIKTGMLNAREGKESFLKSLYKGLFGRTADTAGLNNHLNAMLNGKSRESVISEFLNSAEFNSIYGKLSNGDFLKKLYQNALGRTPDTKGYNEWLAVLNSGSATKASVAKDFLASTEFKNKFAGFAKGTRAIDKNQWAFTQEDGEEAMLTDHGLLTPLKKDTTILNHDATGRLYDFANNTDSFLANYMPALPTFTMPSVVSNQNQTEAPLEFTHHSKVNIYGNADEKVIRKISKEEFEEGTKAMLKQRRRMGL